MGEENRIREEEKNREEENREENREDREETAAEKIRAMTEDVQIPPDLEPEMIEKKLEKRAAVCGTGKIRKEKNTETKKKSRNRFYIGAATAAVLCLLVGAVSAGRFLIGTIGHQSENLAADSGENGNSTQIASAENYSQIYTYIERSQKQKNQNAGSSARSDVQEYSSASGGTSGVSEADSGPADQGSYSDTNVREEGVGEADTVKTDGKNLYILNGQTVSIVGIESDTLEPESQITMDSEGNNTEIYLLEDRLIVLGEKTEEEKGYTTVSIYDTSNPKKPIEINKFTQSGYYNSMREKDGYIYIISNYCPTLPQARTDISAYIPEVDGTTLDAADIYMPQENTADRYTVITAFSLEDPQNHTDTKAVFGNSGRCYISSENIYLTENCYNDEDSTVTRTSIKKISFRDGKLEPVAQVKVDGLLNDSFSIDEYDGYLRMVTTIDSIENNRGVMPLLNFNSGSAAEQKEAKTESLTGNALFVLDQNLETVGEIRGLAPDEQIYSARFMGETVYFVTYRQTDPLFSADLSDPENPEIIGKLKIPGFSEYLHPYGEGKLLGIGMDTDEEGITTEGVKISMFDITDPGNVEEVSKYVLEGMYGTDVAYDYRCAFVDAEKNMIGFTAYGNTNGYYIFTYDETEGFREIFSRVLSGYGSARGLYAGEKFYLICGNTVESYNLDGFEKIDDIVL